MVLKVELDKKLEGRFREAAMKRYGFKKGAIQKATEEAVSIWIDKEPSIIPKLEDPFGAVTGILKHLRGKKTSVQLQHEAKDLWTKSS